MPALLHDQDDQAQDDAEDRCPYVRAQAEVDLALVDADGLPDDPSAAVPDEVEAEEAAPLEREASARPQEHRSAQQVPDHLVEERGVEEGSVGQSGREGGVGAGDLEAPRRIGGKAEQLLVEPVAEASQRLGDDETGGERVGERGEPDAGPPAAEPGTDRAADEGAVDRDAALPDVEDRQEIRTRPEVEAGVRGHVIDARADDRERHGEQGDVDDDPRLGVALGEAAVGQQRRDDDPRDDAQRVVVDREGPTRIARVEGGLGMLATTLRAAFIMGVVSFSAGAAVATT